MKSKKKVNIMKPRVRVGFNIGTKVFKNKKHYSRKNYKIEQ